MTVGEVLESDLVAVTTIGATDKIRCMVGSTSRAIERDNLFALISFPTGLPIAAAAGTVDAITANYSPDITLADRLVLAFVATGANATTTPTFAPDGLTARTITKNGGSALVAGDIPGALAVCIVSYNLANTRWELLNPAVITQPNTSGLVDKGILTLSSGMNFPAADKGDYYIASGTACRVGGTAVTDPWVNEGDKLECIRDTTAGTYAEVGGDWLITEQVISLPDGRRLITASDNTAISVEAGEHGIGLQGGKWMKEENGVLYPWAGNVYKTIWIPANAMTPAVVNGPAPSGENLAFDAVTEEIADINFPAPEDWNLGTLKGRARWKPATDSGTVGDTVEWKISLAAIRDGDAAATALGTPQVISDAVLTGESATKHKTGATPAITCGGTPAVACEIHMQTTRNVSGTDNHAYDALLEGIELQYLSTLSIAAW